MANSNFIVQNGLTVGPLTIDAATGSISTTGTVNISGGLATSSISKNDSSLTINDTGTGSSIVFNIDGVTEHTMTSDLTTLNGDLLVNSTGYLTVPAGTSAQRPGSPTNGMMRYNSSITSFEGYYAGAWSSLGGVKSVDGKSYITAEASAGAGDDVLRMYAGDSGTSTQAMWVSTSNVKVLPTTVSSSTTTGALQVAGGVGVAGALNIGGATKITDSTASTSATTGALVVTGGVGVSGDMYVNGVLTVANLQARGSTNIVVQDPMLYLQANVLYPWNYDTGVYSDSIGGSANTYVHHGMIRNVSTNEWTFFSNVKSEPGATINWADAGLVYDTVKAGTILPGANVTYNLGSSTAWYNTFYGKATQAQYADLAENYQADKPCAPGTVVMFGGDAEVTIAEADTTRVAGVVSTNPAHLMNGGLTGNNVVPLALQGRVPCNVIGPVKKGDMMISAGFGYAKASANPQVGQVIGKALSDFTGSKGQIEVVVGRV